MDLQSQKTISLLNTFKRALNIHIDKFVYPSDLETTILAYLPSKIATTQQIYLFLRILSALTIAKFTILTRTDFTLQASVNCLRAITMCSAFTPDCGYYNSTFNLIGDVYCPNSKCLCKLCRHKKTFQSLGRSDYQCPQCASVCQVRNNPFEHQTNSFFLVRGRICKYDLHFRKSYIPQFTQKVFQIVAVSSRKPPINDEHDEIIRGKFYQKVFIKVN